MNLLSLFWLHYLNCGCYVLGMRLIILDIFKLLKLNEFSKTNNDCNYQICYYNNNMMVNRCSSFDINKREKHYQEQE